MQGDISQNKIGNWRRLLIIVVVVGLLLSGCGKPEPKVYRVGVLSGMGYLADITAGIKAGMTELGYIEGENIVYDVQETEFDVTVYQSILEKFIDDEVDLIFAFPTDAALEAKALTEGTDIPVVFGYAGILGIGLVDDMREPGGNLTGVRYPGFDIIVKRFEIMREIAPNLERLWIPYLRGYPNIPSQLEALYPAVEAAGVTIIEFPADGAAEVEAELSARAQNDDLGLDGILFLSEPLAVTPDAFVAMAKFAYEHDIPIGGAYIDVGEYASLFGVIPGIINTGEQMALAADTIFRGTPAGTIPVRTPENYIQVNYKAAQALGLTVPESVLNQADEIIR